MKLYHCILGDSSLVRLLTIEDDESTAYINAVYVDVRLFIQFVVTTRIFL